MAPLQIPHIVNGSLSPTKRAQLVKSASPSTPQRTSIRKRKGISLQHKKALVENLRLEITERARRLRAQYHLQAQGLRSRIEMRINRIPMTLRKVKMGDLLLKYMDQDQHQQCAPSRAPPPPVSNNDVPSRMSPQKPPQQVTRTQHTTRPTNFSSNPVVSDKENDVEVGESPRKRVLGNDIAPVQITQVLSPTSSNQRLANRERAMSPTKAYITKTNSPIKMQGTARPAAASNVLSSLVDKAKAARSGGARKVTTASNASSTSSETTTSTRSKRVATAPKAPESRSTTRASRRPSSNSETSEPSTNTAVRKIAGGRSVNAASKKAAGSLKKGANVGEAKSSGTGKVKSTTGRMLRKRA